MQTGAMSNTPIQTLNRGSGRTMDYVESVTFYLRDYSMRVLTCINCILLHVTAWYLLFS